MSAASPLVAQALAGKVIALYGLRDTLLADLSATLSVPSQGLAQVAREAKRRHLLPGAAAAKLIKVDFAYNLIRHLTDERCLAYIQEIRCMIAQTSWDEPSLAKKEEKAEGMEEHLVPQPSADLSGSATLPASGHPPRAELLAHPRDSAVVECAEQPGLLQGPGPAATQPLADHLHSVPEHAEFADPGQQGQAADSAQQAAPHQHPRDPHLVPAHDSWTKDILEADLAAHSDRVEPTGVKVLIDKWETVFETPFAQYSAAPLDSHADVDHNQDTNSSEESADQDCYLQDRSAEKKSIITILSRMKLVSASMLCSRISHSVR